jgi:hypothetical protein
MGSDHDFLAENAGFLGVVPELLLKNAGFSQCGVAGALNPPALRAFSRMRAPGRPGGKCAGLGVFG